MTFSLIKARFDKHTNLRKLINVEEKNAKFKFY